MIRLLKFLNLALAAIIVGVMLVIWFAFNPSQLSAAAYIERQQTFIRLLNVSMPVIGALTILLTFVVAYLRRANRAAASVLVVAAFLFIGCGLITRFCNQPINALVVTWSPQSPPQNWEQYRDEWWRWHIARSVLGVVALGLLVVGYRLAPKVIARNQSAPV
jgi:uncharacterized membrane protein